MSVHTVFPVVDTQPVVSKIGLLDAAIERKELFLTLDSRAREIEKSLKSTWSELADICATMQANELWREGGFESFGQWLMAACPCSRSMAYDVLKLRVDLQDIPDAEIREIPLGNAKILQNTPKNRRNGHLIEQAKQQPPREFIRTVIDSVPESHLEEKFVHRFRLTAGQSKTVQAAFDMWRLLNDDPHAHAEDALEALCADYLLAHQAEYQDKLAKL